MRHVLVVANNTAVGTHITTRLSELASTGPLDVFLLVPMARRAMTGPDGQPQSAFAWSNRNLRAGMEAIRNMGIEVQGALGPMDPMEAVAEVLEQHSMRTILVSTRALGRSRWLAMDFPHRLARKYDDRAVEHLIATADAATMSAPSRSGDGLEVLLVEDNPADVELAREALAGLDNEINVSVARDGAQAIEYLRVQRPLPDLVLLDLKMPVVDGHGVLRELADELGIDALNEIFIAVVTSSPAEKDRLEAHTNGARAYIVKTPDFEDFEAALGSLVSEIVAA